MKVKEKLVIGDFIDGSAVVYKKENMNLIKGLMFENGSTKFFYVLHFGNFRDGLSLIDTGKKLASLTDEENMPYHSNMILLRSFQKSAALF